jgi:protocatechuate 3,4-dioxygenase beta subunit
MGFTRREWLGSMAGAVAVAPTARTADRQGGLNAFASADLVCADAGPTPSIPADASYKAGAPNRTALTAPGHSGVPLTLSGVVAGVSCGPIAGAVVEFWHADGRGVYDMRGSGLRGQQHTDDRGRYRLTTIVPGAAPGRAPCLHVHVVVPGRAELWTALFFAGRPENARDARVKEALLVTLSNTAEGVVGVFDIRLDL